MENPQEPQIPDVAPLGSSPIGKVAENPSRTPPPLTRMRTYQDDISDAVKGDNMSAAKIFLAEEERRQRRQRIDEATSPETPKNKVMLVASAILVVLAIGGFAFFRFFYRPAPPPEVTVEVPLFIRSDSLVEIPAADRSYRDVQADLRREAGTSVTSREIRQIALSESRGGVGAKQIPSERLFGAIGAFPPSELPRALAPEFFVGVYGSSKGPLPFLILHASNPDLARAAMLAWEETMANDLAPIFPGNDEYLGTVAAQPTMRAAWVDTVYQNRDARVLARGDEEVLLWGFDDSGDIIIASDPFLLPEMASRLARDRELH